MDDEKQGDVTIDLFAALDMETNAIEERKSELQNSQTLGLLTGFLSVDDWYAWLVKTVIITSYVIFSLLVCIIDGIFNKMDGIFNKMDSLPTSM